MSFYPGVRPVDLIPGDPGALRAAAGTIDTLAGGFSSSSAQLRGINGGSWQGQAADAFRGAVGMQPGMYTRAAQAFSQAAGAMRTYASALESAQSEASVAIAAYRQAQQETALWQQQQQAAAAHHVTVSSYDPGEHGRARAYAILEGAQANLRASVAALRSALGAAAGVAPRQPSLFGELRHEASHISHQMLHYEALLTSQRFFWSGCSGLPALFQPLHNAKTDECSQESIVDVTATRWLGRRMFGRRGNDLPEITDWFVDGATRPTTIYGRLTQLWDMPGTKYGSRVHPVGPSAFTGRSSGAGSPSAGAVRGLSGRGRSPVLSETPWLSSRLRSPAPRREVRSGSSDSIHPCRRQGWRQTS